jgi:hypothetical protein
MLEKLGRPQKAVHTHYTNPMVWHSVVSDLTGYLQRAEPAARRISGSIVKGDTAYCLEDMNRISIIANEMQSPIEV